MKKTKIYIIAVLWLVLLSQLVVNKLFVKEELVMEAFSGTNSDILESNLDAWGLLGNVYLSEVDKEDIIGRVAQAIGLNNEYELQSTDYTNLSETSMVKKSKNATTIIKIVTMYEPNGSKEIQQHILINLSIYENIESILQYKKIIEEELGRLKVNEQEIFLKFTGIYDGKLSLSEKNDITDNLLDIMQAHVVAENRNEEAFTVYAYTGLIREFIYGNNSRININIAIIYDEVQDKSYLYLATPIISSEY